MGNNIGSKCLESMCGEMEQSSGQQAPQSPGQAERPWWQFKPGQSGNPEGGGRTIKNRIAIEAEKLVRTFVARFGRVPDDVEVGYIGNAARLRVRLNKRSLDDDTLSQLNRDYDRAMRACGMRTPPTPTSGDGAAASSRRSAHEILGGK